jgi:hypothetical protein
MIPEPICIPHLITIAAAVIFLSALPVRLWQGRNSAPSSRSLGGWIWRLKLVSTRWSRLRKAKGYLGS